MTTIRFACAGLLLAGCSTADPRPSVAEADEQHSGAEAGSAASGEHHAESAGGREPLRVAEDGSRVFGSELDADLEMTPLATMIADPARFAGQTVKTEGEIAQVCARAGCWMELRAEGSDTAVRVPMAGHSFFLPREVAGRRATVQGTVEVRQLDEATQEHLRAEGAQAAGQALGIEATAVVVY